MWGEIVDTGLNDDIVKAGGSGGGGSGGSEDEDEDKDEDESKEENNNDLSSSTNHLTDGTILASGTSLWVFVPPDRVMPGRTTKKETQDEEDKTGRMAARKRKTKAKL